MGERGEERRSPEGPLGLQSANLAGGGLLRATHSSNHLEG